MTDDYQEPTDEQVRELARKLEDDELTIDGGALVSQGSDNGAWIQAWVWVSFVDTPFDKEEPKSNAPG